MSELRSCSWRRAGLIRKSDREVSPKEIAFRIHLVLEAEDDGLALLALQLVGERLDWRLRLRGMY